MKIILSKQTLVKEILISNLKKICSKFKLSSFDQNLFELENDDRFIEQLNIKVNSNNHFKKRYFNSVYDFSVYRNLIYILVRLTKPNFVVETGVLHGLTSAWILKALSDNKKGHLVSIDIKRSDWKKFFKKKKMGPGFEHDLNFPKDEKPGWIIPDYLKKRWKLVYGPSNKKLKLINNKIDFFIHDSDHSYQNVEFEINTILRKNINSWIVIDNYDFNSFSFDFLTKNFVKKKNFIYSIVDEVDDQLLIEESAILLKKIIQ